jgi:hypothetical protein
MKYFFGCAILMILSPAFQMVKDHKSATADNTMLESTPVAVVELFTSQGCSSCPAADKLLNDVISAAQNTSSPVIGLSFHVTYWNHLGWQDPYSNEQFTERQKAYATTMKLSSIYTPQMIVNGSAEFVGSDSGALSSAIAAALHQRPRYLLTSTATTDGKEVVIDYSVDNDPEGELLHAAIVEPSVQNEVPRGENRGLTLKHYNVVRKLQTWKLQKKAALKISVPADVGTYGKAFIVLYIQNPIDWKIVGARRITVNKSVR